MNAPAAAALRARITQGFELLRRGRADLARQLGRDLAVAHPGHPDVLFLLCEAHLEAGDTQAALQAIEAAVAAAPRVPALRLKQADILLVLRRRSEARSVAAALAAEPGTEARTHWLAGRVFARSDDPRGAIPHFEAALRSGLQHPALRYDLAAAQFYSGDFDAAESLLDAALAQAPQAGPAHYLRATLRRQTPERNHVESLRRVLAEGIADPAARAACHYALAKELEDLDDAEQSFAHLQQGASIWRSTLNHDAAGECAAIDRIAAVYSADAMRALSPGVPGAGPIFVVGMPRTGTTLVERMLGRHAAVRSAGELQDFGQLLGAAARRCLAAGAGSDAAEASLKLDFAALGRDYLAGARDAAGGSRHFIDKMPINFMYVGPILQALPEARIVHLVRDPMDTCYAVYKTLFHQAYPFSYDLRELADYYLAYRRLMRHWHAVLPGRILDVRYEDLVTDTEAQARRLLDGCGLDWHEDVIAPDANANPASTASAAQVRQPVYATSVNKWRQYAAGLEPLRARLQAGGIVDADGVPVD
jgi:tetratricopeptide (TPR) repeat protein